LPLLPVPPLADVPDDPEASAEDAPADPVALTAVPVPDVDEPAVDEPADVVAPVEADVAPLAVAAFDPTNPEPDEVDCPLLPLTPPPFAATEGFGPPMPH
jgi:hypothetical protein